MALPQHNSLEKSALVNIFLQLAIYHQVEKGEFGDKKN